MFVRLTLSLNVIVPEARAKRCSHLQGILKGQTDCTLSNDEGYLDCVVSMQSSYHPVHVHSQGVHARLTWLLCTRAMLLSVLIPDLVIWVCHHTPLRLI